APPDPGSREHRPRGAAGSRRRGVSDAGAEAHREALARGAGHRRGALTSPTVARRYVTLVTSAEDCGVVFRLVGEAAAACGATRRETRWRALGLEQARTH